jgi:hypothetical protein
MRFVRICSIAVLIVLARGACGENFCSAINCFNGEGGVGSSRYEERCKEWHDKAQSCIDRVSRSSSNPKQFCSVEIDQADRDCGCARTCIHALCTRFTEGPQGKCYEATYKE